MSLRHFLPASLMLWLLASVPLWAMPAMAPMSEDEMAEVSGAGIAIALENFRYMLAPTSYMEQVGVAPAGACTGTGSTASNTNCWRRGDLRWYGINLSGASGAGSHWDESACDAGSLSCPRGGLIGGAGGWFSPFDNPYVMRAWSPQGIDYSGAPVNADPANPDKTIYEYLAPTQQPYYTLSFWGEIEAGATRDPSMQALSSGTGESNGGGLLKSQTIIRGNAAGSVFRMFKFTQPGNETFGMTYTSYLRGDFRFSVAQSGAGTDAIGVPPVFDNNEGLHFRNVDAYLPLGQLYYQAFVVGQVGTDGDFYLELTKIPENSLVYNQFYSLNSGDVRGFDTALAATRNWNVPCGPTDTLCQNYRKSHGYVRYGDYYPGMGGPGGWAATGTREAINATDDGIFFRKCDNCANFNAFAKRPMVIDKRGENGSMQYTQNYNCGTGGTGGCVVGTTNVSYTASGQTTTLAPGGPVVQGPGSNTRLYNTGAVSLGSSRIEGLLIHQLYLESCQPGTC